MLCSFSKSKSPSPNPAYLGWSAWSAWTACNDDGEKFRSRKCLTTQPGANECQGNEREQRDCNAIVATAGLGTGGVVLACFMAVAIASTVSAYIMYVLMKRRIAPRDLKSIGSPCFDSFPNQYSSLPTKDDRPKVKRQTSFNSGGGGSSGANGGANGTTGGILLHSSNGGAELALGSAAVAISNGRGASAKLLVNGTLTKSNNVNGHQTPKVLAKGHFVDVDTATIKRNSHGLNNVRPLLRAASDDDKF